MSFTQQGWLIPSPPSKETFHSRCHIGVTQGHVTSLHSTSPHFHLPSPPSSCLISHEGMFCMSSVYEVPSRKV